MTDARVVEQPTKLRHFTVTAMRIDSLNLNRLDFIKMDVEGMKPKPSAALSKRSSVSGRR
jgi:hypothetical protein